MDVEPPAHLLGRLRLGREEFVQRLLTTLILDGPYPKWNTSTAPSARGQRFLQALDELCFGGAPALPTAFVDEFDLPPRRQGERGGAPDWAVVSNERVWLIELKTEPGSHRPDQIPLYATLGTHHYPGAQIDLTYLTPPISVHEPAITPTCRYRHVTWPEVLPLIKEVWGDAPAPSQEIVVTVEQVLASIGTPWLSWRDARLAAAAATPAPPPKDDRSVLRDALRAVAETRDDGRQRALDAEFESLEAMHAFRLLLRDAILAETPSGQPLVRPWVWSEQTSGGTAMTSTGHETGYELRLSRDRPAGRSLSRAEDPEPSS